MTRTPVSDPSPPAKNQRAELREARLKLALKANMARRKARVRAVKAEARAGSTGDDNDKG